MSATADLHSGHLLHGIRRPTVLRMGFTSSALNPPGVPDLSSISLELSRDLELHTGSIKSCPIMGLYTTQSAARRRCAASIVGRGRVESEVLLSEQEVPVTGAMTAFFHLDEGQPRILGLVTTAGPTPLSYVLPFRIETEKGQFGTKLVIPEMRQVHGLIRRGGYAYTFPNGYGRISRLNLVLRRSFAQAGRRTSFVTTACSAGSGQAGGDSPLLRATLSYSKAESVGGMATTLTTLVDWRCRRSA